MDAWREPTIEEAQVISKHAKKALIGCVITTFFSVVMLSVLFFIGVLFFYLKKDYLWGSITMLFSVGAIAFGIWVFISDVRIYDRARKLDYQVVIGVYEKK